MWALRNHTPFAAERGWVRDMNGAEVWLVAIKGTFDIGPHGILRIAETQEPVNIAPQMRGCDPYSSLLFDTDLPYRKSNTDVLVEGHAYTSGGRPSQSITVRLKIATIDKTLKVTGDRTWENSVSGAIPGRPTPFAKMPVIFEKSYGGVVRSKDHDEILNWEPRNPSGCGFGIKAHDLLGTPVPNVEYPQSPIRHWRDRPTPAGLAPISGHWKPRAQLAGTYDREWEMTRQPLLASDFNEMYYQSAPNDQQAKGFLRGGELVEIENMTPNGWLSFNLPKLAFALTTRFDDGTYVNHRADMHTITIKPDFPKVEIVWHTHHECHHKALKLNNTSIRIKRRLSDRNRDE